MNDVCKLKVDVFRILELDAMIFAQQITLLQHCLFSRIKSKTNGSIDIRTLT